MCEINPCIRTAFTLRASEALPKYFGFGTDEDGHYSSLTWSWEPQMFVNLSD
jgi:hypothetical protein